MIKEGIHKNLFNRNKKLSMIPIKKVLENVKS